MKFLVTGITGFAGPHLAKLLLKEGHEVHGVLRGANGRETDLSRHRVFYRQKETNSARYLDECESTGFTMTVEMDRRAECECCGTDLKLLGNFDYRGEIMTARIVYKAYREDEYYYSPPEWQGIDWRTTDYRVKNPDVLLEGAINDLMKQLMTYLYENDTREEV